MRSVLTRREGKNWTNYREVQNDRRYDYISDDGGPLHLLRRTAPGEIGVRLPPLPLLYRPMLDGAPGKVSREDR